MERIAIDVEIERNSMRAHSVRRPISKALGFAGFAMNYTAGCNGLEIRRGSPANLRH